jgi:hypothetical protein
MEITLGTTKLCHGASRTQDQWCGPQGLRVSSQRQSQPAPRIRAAQAALFARGNRLETVSFTVTMRCASVSAAASAIVGLPASIPASGALTVGGTSYGPASCDFSAEQIGATVRATFTLIAGAAS